METKRGTLTSSFYCALAKRQARRLLITRTSHTPPRTKRATLTSPARETQIFGDKFSKNLVPLNFCSGNNGRDPSLANPYGGWEMDESIHRIQISAVFSLVFGLLEWIDLCFLVRNYAFACPCASPLRFAAVPATDCTISQFQASPKQNSQGTETKQFTRSLRCHCSHPASPLSRLEWMRSGADGRESRIPGTNSLCSRHDWRARPGHIGKGSILGEPIRTGRWNSRSNLLHLPDQNQGSRVCKLGL